MNPPYIYYGVTYIDLVAVTLPTQKEKADGVKKKNAGRKPVSLVLIILNETAALFMTNKV